VARPRNLDVSHSIELSEGCRPFFGTQPPLVRFFGRVGRPYRTHLRIAGTPTFGVRHRCSFRVIKNFRGVGRSGYAAGVVSGFLEVAGLCVEHWFVLARDTGEFPAAVWLGWKFTPLSERVSRCQSFESVCSEIYD